MKFLTVILVSIFLNLAAQAQSDKDVNEACFGPTCAAYQDQYTVGTIQETSGAYANSLRKYNLKEVGNCANCGIPQGLEHTIESDGAPTAGGADTTGGEAGGTKARQ